MKNILGGKGVNLVEMMNIGLFVFFGFIILIDVCNDYMVNNKNFFEVIFEEVKIYLVELEK